MGTRVTYTTDLLRGGFYILGTDMLGMHAAFIVFQGAGLTTGSVHGFTNGGSRYYLYSKSSQVHDTVRTCSTRN